VHARGHPLGHHQHVAHHLHVRVVQDVAVVHITPAANIVR
jgi:hypothetical protein